MLDIKTIDMKTQRFLPVLATVILAGAMFLAGCEKETPAGTTGIQQEWPLPQNRTGYVVDKITWYESSTNHTEAYYEYNEDNKLVKRIINVTIMESYGLRNSTYIDTFLYQNGHVSRIHTTASPEENFGRPDWIFYYDEQGRLMRYEYGNNVVCVAYSNGLPYKIYKPDNEEFYTILKYDSAGNIVRTDSRVPECNMWGDPTGRFEIRTSTYEYDNAPRPNFNLDNVWVYEPIFGMGTSYETCVRILSKNNMKRYSVGPETWEYEYNELGFPKTMYFQFANVVPTHRTVYTFTYRQVNNKM